MARKEKTAVAEDDAWPPQTSQPTYQVTIAGPSAQPYEYPTGISLLCTLLALAFGTFLMALDTTIIMVAIPGITTQFDALNQVGWIGSAYLITLTAFQPIAGSAYKNFDPKRTYLAFMVVFEGKLEVFQRNFRSLILDD